MRKQNTMKFKIYSLLFLFLTFMACDEFEDMNLNPNEPTEVTADVLLPSSIRRSMLTLVNESFLLGNNAAQLTAKVLRTEVDSYNWNAFPTVWEGFYKSLTDVINVEEIAKSSSNEVLEGAAITLRSMIFANLTNLYGDVPYSEAIQGANDNITPKYDEQSAIYQDLLNELARANTLLSSGNGSIGGDILFGGDAAQWRKFANSLRLRLLMTANNQIGDAASQFAQIVNAGNIINSNAENAVFTFDSSFPNQYPLIPLKTGDFDAVALSQSALDVMNQYQDPRLARYARPDNDNYTNPTFSGAVNGSSTANCLKIGSRLGAQYYNDPAQTTADELGLPIAEGVIITYAEVSFLLAEAVEKGWINGNPETYYRNGIEASMDYHQVDYTSFGYSDFSDYYANSGVAYNTATDIWEQKWLSLFFHGFEPYVELRRWYFESGMSWDGIPFIGPSCDNLNNDNLPLRFLYPGQEQSLNQANFNEAVNRLGDNSFNASIWLMQ